MIKLRLIIVYIIVLSVNGFADDRGAINTSSSEVFSKLNFTVSIDYSSKALQKLQKSNEKIKVLVIIDQYGKQYMEEEAVADKEIIINPGEKAVFYGIPSTESHYRYKKNKKYILTINVISARKIFENNILDCYAKAGKIDYDISQIQGKVLKYQCKLIR